MDPDRDIRQAAAGLTRQIGDEGTPVVEPLAGGANNRVFEVHTQSGHYLLKQYFRHPSDPRDRLGTEFRFLRFGWSRGVTAIPEPLACDDVAGLGLYRFVEGRRLAPGGVRAEHVDQAWDFFGALNDRRDSPDAGELPTASEACFSIAEHVHTVSRRVDRLGAIPAEDPVDRDARAFVAGSLIPEWDRVLERLRALASRWHLELDRPLSRKERCLSPSDFGFHNALETPTGRLIFLDFEYAGWDDPAKAVCDFFCQVAVPAPASMFEPVAARVVSALGGAGRDLQRMSLLLPAYRIKWCCIVLNHFLPVAAQRRAFARSDDGGEQQQREAKAGQLALATSLLGIIAS